MLISADQVLAHAVGDYLIQSDWMANEKTKQHAAAAVHAVTYGLPFLFLTWNPWALLAIISTHFVIDRWRLARYVVWLKNWPWQPWAECSGTGYHKDRPPFVAVWLLIIADNILHVMINGLALRYLP